MTKEMQQLYDRISKLEKSAMELSSSISVEDSLNKEFDIRRKNMLLGKAVGYAYVLVLIEEMDKKAAK